MSQAVEVFLDLIPVNDSCLYSRVASHGSLRTVGSRDCRMKSKLAVECRSAVLHEVSKFGHGLPVCSKDTQAYQNRYISRIRSVQGNPAIRRMQVMKCE